MTKDYEKIENLRKWLGELGREYGRSQELNFSLKTNGAPSFLESKKYTVYIFWLANESGNAEPKIYLEPVDSIVFGTFTTGRSYMIGFNEGSVYAKSRDADLAPMGVASKLKTMTLQGAAIVTRRVTRNIPSIKERFVSISHSIESNIPVRSPRPNFKTIPDDDYSTDLIDFVADELTGRKPDSVEYSQTLYESQSK